MRYSPEEIERGLTALILAGNSVTASEVTGIPSSTLREWKMGHSEQYARLMRDLEPQVVQKIAGEAEGMVNRIFGLAHKTLDEYEDKIHELKPGEAAAAGRNLATMSALYIDKHSSPLRERPSHVNQGADLEGLMHMMARALGKQHVPNEAETINSSAIALPLPAEADTPNARD